MGRYVDESRYDVFRLDASIDDGPPPVSSGENNPDCFKAIFDLKQFYYVPPGCPRRRFGSR